MVGQGVLFEEGNVRLGCLGTSTVLQTTIDGDGVSPLISARHQGQLVPSEVAEVTLSGERFEVMISV